MLWTQMAPRLIASCCFASTLNPRMSVADKNLVVALSLGSVVSRMQTPAPSSHSVCKLPHLRRPHYSCRPTNAAVHPPCRHRTPARA